MGYVGLFLSGAVLFINSLMLLGKASAKSVGVINILVGALQIIIPFYLIVVSAQGHWEIYNHASIFLFGLTYLYVGFTLLNGLDGSGLGWFSLWVAIIGIIYTLTSIIHFHNVINALTWGMWAFLWFLFFLSNALNKKIEHYIGIVALVQSWVTLTIPALLYFLGVWNTQVMNKLWIYVLILAISIFIISYFRWRFVRKKENNEISIQVINALEVK